MKTATLVDELEEWGSDARLYELSEPYYGYSYIIISAIDVDYDFYVESETYIFGATSNGMPFDMCELNGSFKGEKNHAKALENMDYELILPL